MHKVLISINLTVPRTLSYMLNYNPCIPTLCTLACYFKLLDAWQYTSNCVYRYSVMGDVKWFFAVNMTHMRGGRMCIHRST